MPTNYDGSCFHDQDPCPRCNHVYTVETLPDPVEGEDNIFACVECRLDIQATVTDDRKQLLLLPAIPKKFRGRGNIMLTEEHNPFLAQPTNPFLQPNLSRAFIEGNVPPNYFAARKAEQAALAGLATEQTHDFAAGTAPLVLPASAPRPVPPPVKKAPTLAPTVSDQYGWIFTPQSASRFRLWIPTWAQEALQVVPGRKIYFRRTTPIWELWSDPSVQVPLAAVPPHLLVILKEKLIEHPQQCQLWQAGQIEAAESTKYPVFRTRTLGTFFKEDRAMYRWLVWWLQVPRFSLLQEDGSILLPASVSRSLRLRSLSVSPHVGHLILQPHRSPRIHPTPPHSVLLLTHKQGTCGWKVPY